MNPTVVEGDGAILGQSTLRNPASYLKAALQRDVECRPVSTRLTARDDSLEHEATARSRGSEPSGTALLASF